MNSKETEIVNEAFIARRDNYNKAVGGEGGSNFKGKKHSDETKLKLSEIAKNRIISDETRQKISDGNRRRVLSEETKLKLSEKAKLRFSTKEAKQAHSDLMKSFYNKNI